MLCTGEANDCDDCAIGQHWETVRDPATATISGAFVKDLADAPEAAQTQAPE
jgi:DNA-binding IscR family transcriptional regulator